MSNAIRPIQRTPRQRLSRLLDAFRKIVGGDRFENLYRAIQSEVAAIGKPPRRLLDYGCGAMTFSLRLKADGQIEHFIGMDVYPEPVGPERHEPRWLHYRQISTLTISSVPDRFDMAIVVDVLHHAPEAEQAQILATLAAMSEFVLVKDHFEYGFASRHLLRLADWYGNYAYGVNVPARYFSESRWKELVNAAGLIETKLQRNVRVHDGLFGLIIPPRNHFISILHRDQADRS